MRHSIAVIALLLISVPALAQAQPATASQTPLTFQPAPAPTETTHYGWKVAAADGLAWSTVLFHPGLWLTGYLLGGPAVHLAHDNRKGAWVSVGLRLALPIIGVYATDRLTTCATGPSFCGLGGAFWGGIIGMGTASIIDWLFLAKRTTARQTTPMRPGIRIGEASVLPNVSVDRQGNTSFGLTGTF